jgi:hypothetical protein
VSKSDRTSHSHARKPGKAGKRATAPAAAPDACTRPPGRPWVIGGIDYGPAIAAVSDLIGWAFDLAERDVADWPEGLRRVRTARRFALARLRDKRPRSVPVDDVLFTAGLLARIFEADLRLPMSEVVEVLAQLGLPTEMVPLMPRAPSEVCRPQEPPLAPIMPLRPRPAPVAVRSAPADVCDECGQPAPRFRIAA